MYIRLAVRRIGIGRLILACRKTVLFIHCLIEQKKDDTIMDLKLNGAPCCLALSL